MGMCPSPPLIAAFHVLHRLKVPRHSPHALSSLTIKLVHKQNAPVTSYQMIFVYLLTIDFLQLVDFLHVFSFQISRSSTYCRK
jgi:hypothetical protein